MRWGDDTPLTTVAVVIVFTAIAWAAHAYVGGVVALGAGLFAGMTWTGALPHRSAVGLRLLGILAGYGLMGLYLRNWWVGRDMPWTVPYLWFGATFVCLLVVARRAGNAGTILTNGTRSQGPIAFSPPNPQLTRFDSTKSPLAVSEPDRPSRMDLPRYGRTISVIQFNPSSSLRPDQSHEIHILRDDQCMFVHPHDLGGYQFLKHVHEEAPVFLSPTPPAIANGIKDFPSAVLIACDEDVDLILGYARDAGVNVVDGPSRACRPFARRTETPTPPQNPQRHVSSKQIDPHNQGMTSALLEGAMRSGSLTELMDLIDLLLESNATNLEVLYELAQEDHPGIPLWDDLLDHMNEEGMSQEPMFYERT
jgi:hypothetical protein